VVRAEKDAGMVEENLYPRGEVVNPPQPPGIRKACGAPAKRTYVDGRLCDSPKCNDYVAPVIPSRASMKDLQSAGAYATYTEAAKKQAKKDES
jgi:hypothetical protein